MRLNKKKKGNFVGPISCFALLGLITLGIACPEFGSNASALTCSEDVVDPTYTTRTGVGTDGQYIEGTDKVTAQASYNEYVRTCSDDTTFGFTVQSEAANAEANGEYEFGFQVYKGPGNTTVTSDPFNITFDVKEFIQITTENNAKLEVNMTATPTVEGATASEAANFTVASNNSKGFEVLVYAADDKVNLTSETEANTSAIAPISTSDIALSDFSANTWGYNVVEATESVTSYKPITTKSEATAIYSYNSATAGKALKLACGTKVDTSLPADTYQTEVVISAVAPFNARMITE